MSGWIKMGTGLRSHPKVVRMASALKADRLRVVGALHAVWVVFDEHSNGGVLDGYTSSVMDDEIGWRGFSAAMASIGWLVETPDGLEAPDYEEHNGPVAKRRAMETSRKGRARKVSASCAPDDGTESGQVSACDADKLRNRGEERREEQIQDPPAARVPPVRKGSRKCPPEFGVTAEMWQWAQAEAPGVNVDRETAKLRDHTFGTARVDWVGTWKNWIRKAAEMQPRSGRVDDRMDRQLQTAALMTGAVRAIRPINPEQETVDVDARTLIA